MKKIKFTTTFLRDIFIFALGIIMREHSWGFCVETPGAYLVRTDGPLIAFREGGLS